MSRPPNHEYRRHRGAAPASRVACVATLVATLFAITVAVVWNAAAAPPTGATTATRTQRIPLPVPRSLSGEEMVLLCFESQLTAVTAPSCFADPPNHSGDCTSSDQHYFIQFFDPVAFLGNFDDTWRVTEIAFVSNDGDTVWPSAGIILLPWDLARFPNTSELMGLQAHDIPSVGDTSEVNVDLRPSDIEFTMDHIFYIALQFPAGGRLNAPLDGPGIAVDETDPDPPCDFLTHDAGQTWLENAENDPLDWGFAVVVEPIVAVDETSWTRLKLIYRGGTGIAIPIGASPRTSRR